MNLRDKSGLDRIAEESAFISEVAAKISEECFLGDLLLQHALCMSLITIGECSARLSREFKDSHPQIEWVQITAVRNIAAHGYWQLDMRQIWRAVKDDIPVLSKFIEDLLIRDEAGI